MNTSAILPPLTELVVVDADLIPTDDPFIQSIHVWYEAFGLPVQQSSMCGFDFIFWLREVAGRIYATVQSYWYSVHPHERDTDVARYMVHRANQLNRNN